MIELDLNDWFRFDRPGTYRLFLKSHRLSRARKPGEPGHARETLVHFAAVSNVLVVRIVPDDPAWTRMKIFSIGSILENRHSPSEQAWRALRDASHLPTPVAVDLAFEDALRRGGVPDELMLFGARDRGHAIAAYDRYLANPVIPIQPWDIWLRAHLEYVRLESPSPPRFGARRVPGASDPRRVREE